MTETNMILSNPFHGERRAGSVGLPLPGVEVRVAPEDSNESSASPGTAPGFGILHLCSGGVCQLRKAWHYLVHSRKK